MVTKWFEHRLYAGEIYHHRNYPKHHEFRYKVFMFYLNINTITTLMQHPLISRNRLNLFSFYDQDYLPELAPYVSKESPNPVFDRIQFFLKNKNIILKRPQFFLLTNLRFLNYVFNPVSFYYCYDGEKPICALAEVHNTFKERKIYFVEQVKQGVQNKELKGGTTENFNWFNSKQLKDFYVSPFSHPHTHFNFQLGEARERVKAIVNEISGSRKYFHSYFAGNERDLTVVELIKSVLSFIPVTFKVTLGIHWQAFRLWVRRVPYYKKREHAEYQKHFFKK